MTRNTGVEHSFVFPPELGYNLRLMNQKYLYLTVFISGMTTLAVEMAASRLLGSVFGTSNLVWASIIGLIMIYLTVGYSLGGRWADRWPNSETFYTFLIWGAFSSGLVPFFARPVLSSAADAFDALEMGVLFGSFTAVLVLFVVPITLLGTVSPFAIRLSLQDSRKAGQVSGKVYAISTLGSFVGTFIPTLFLIPLIGTTYTFLAFSGLLVLVAILGLWLGAGPKAALKWSWMPLLLAVLAILWGRGNIKASAGQIYEAESAYNYIQVLEQGDYRYLRLNEGQGVHSIYHPEQLAFHGPWMQVLAAPFFNPAPYEIEQVKSLGVIGLAAGTISTQATQAFGPIAIDGFEIDPQIIRVGQDYFGMTQSNLNPIAQDGRWGLAHSSMKYTIISIDAYRPPYIPWHLTTQEFFQTVHDHLSDDGVLVINVGRAPGDRRLIEGLVGTISTLFPSIYVMDIPDTFNSMVYATVQPTEIGDLYANYQALDERTDIHPVLMDAVQRAIAYMQPNPCEGPQPAAGCIVFIDDQAPIEWITNNMILNYVLFGGIEELQ